MKKQKKAITFLPLFIFLLGFFVQRNLFAEEKNLVCIQVYDPVCAELDTGIRCVTTPCPSLMQKTFSNACEAQKRGAKILYRGACKEEKRGLHKTWIPPHNCISWFDGCNHCTRSRAGEALCTMRFCAEGEKGEARCLLFDEEEPKNDKKAPKEDSQKVEIKKENGEGGKNELELINTKYQDREEHQDKKKEKSIENNEEVEIIQKTQKVKLFGIFPLYLRSKIIFNRGTQSIVKEEKPWWSIFAF